MSEEKRCFLINTYLHRSIPEHSILASDEKILFITSHKNALENFVRINNLPDPVHEMNPVLGWAERELREYFDGKRKVFSFPFQLSGTHFQQKVYQTLYNRIKYGHTVSYGELASMSGYPHAARAAGSAMKNNPLPFIIPCHRVVKA
ncbi:MAG: hypothetical protein DRP86_04590, partial [Candidatus Neomarinimicrobiota bacterium]